MRNAQSKGRREHRLLCEGSLRNTNNTQMGCIRSDPGKKPGLTRQNEQV